MKPQDGIGQEQVGETQTPKDIIWVPRSSHAKGSTTLDFPVS